MKRTLNLMICLFLLSGISYSQTDKSKLDEIDSLFIEWNRPNHPGGTVGISKNGVPVFSKAYGLASLEYLVPNTYGTSFNIASVSKQFTAMGIVKLHLAGRLSIDDDIRKYLPELPDFDYSITFRHMLHHTSGLRSLHTLLALAGWRDDDMKNNDDLLRFISMQQDLNFEPGSEYMYSNTGYILAAIIIERITGEDFADWMKKEIFQVLGLYDTYVEDKYNRVVTNYATSYNGSYNRGFDREIEYWAYTGSGNIHSTTADLLRWMRFYYNAPRGWEEAFSMMLTLDEFNNGEPNDYAFGVRIDEYKDEKRISHSGSIGGYRAYACTFPEHETEIAVLTNFSSSDVSGKVNRISDIILDIPEEESMPVQLEAAEIDPEKIEKFIGTYDLENSDTRMLEIMIANDSLFCRYTGGRKIYLQTASDSVLFNNDRNIKISLLTTSPPSLKIFSGSQVNSAEKADKFIAGRKYLEHVAGTYFSPELETQYRFYVRDDKLFGYHTRHGEFPVESLKEDIFISGSGFISKIVIVRERNKISGMKVSNSRVRDLWLERR